MESEGWKKHGWSSTMVRNDIFLSLKMKLRVIKCIFLIGNLEIIGRYKNKSLIILLSRIELLAFWCLYVVPSNLKTFLLLYTLNTNPKYIAWHVYNPSPRLSLLSFYNMWVYMCVLLHIVIKWNAKILCFNFFHLMFYHEYFSISWSSLKFFWS